ncbi:transcription/translation regulatory transformer protein RfaH, partial [Vibrio parahaemolyticus]|nr:transcription/translation regulatory transformer protein RfaH [Vibrio parahaemolyticus]
MKRWYLLYCNRGEQIRAKQHLENQGVECFYPTEEVEKILRGKRQKVEEPV